MLTKTQALIAPATKPSPAPIRYSEGAFDAAQSVIVGVGAGLACWAALLGGVAGFLALVRMGA